MNAITSINDEMRAFKIMLTWQYVDGWPPGRCKKKTRALRVGLQEEEDMILSVNDTYPDAVGMGKLEPLKQSAPTC